MAKVIVYTTPTCGFCPPVKKFLEEKGVDYEEIDVSQDEKYVLELREKTGQLGVPVVEIGDEIVIGFNREKISELLEKMEE